MEQAPEFGGSGGILTAPPERPTLGRDALKSLRRTLIAAVCEQEAARGRRN